MLQHREFFLRKHFRTENVISQSNSGQYVRRLLKSIEFWEISDIMKAKEDKGGYAYEENKFYGYSAQGYSAQGYSALI